MSDETEVVMCCECGLDVGDSVIWIENLLLDIDEYATRICPACAQRCAGRLPYGNVVEGDMIDPLLILNKCLGFVPPDATEL